jgi:hypothetical protein
LAIETNIRIVEPGEDLAVFVRHANVRGADLTSDLLEKACGKLRYRRHLAAVVVRGTVPGIIVATDRPIPNVQLADEEWELEVTDAGEDARPLSLRDPQGLVLIPKLLERALQGHIATRTNFWTLGTSRVWYERTPICSRDGINAYRRYELAAVTIDGAGIGIACDVGTAFFTTHPLSYFFQPNLSHAETERRARELARLTDRQAGQKGTLLYDIGSSRSKCYFEQAPPGVTCANTGSFRVQGETFSSLADYYRKKRPELGDMSNVPAVRVSFERLGRPRWVAASRAWARVMNDSLPGSLNTIDKIVPEERRRLVGLLWDRLGERPFGGMACGVSKFFWRPNSQSVSYFAPSQLQYARANLAAPRTATSETLRDHYRARGRFLQDHGCYDVPAVVDRTLYVAYPARIEKDVATSFITDLIALVNRLTGSQFAAEPVAYNRVADGIEQLRRRARSGTALFVLDPDPASYHEVAFQLQGWRIKRVTERVLAAHHNGLVGRSHQPAHKGRARWEQFIRMNTLDLLQRMDIVPWRLERAGAYEAQLAIDVGHDRRHFALSLMIARTETARPSFKIATKVQVKSDPKHEAINARFLSDHIVAVVDGALGRDFTPIASLLVLRDGRSCGREPEGIEAALTQLRERGYLTADARVDVVEVHKKSLKYVRFWRVDNNGVAVNPLEGTAVKLGSKTILVATTGDATVRQGTVEPLMLIGNGHCRNVTDAGEGVFQGAQLNWSSPTVAQSLPLALKRTDEELRSRADQEIRRIR